MPALNTSQLEVKKKFTRILRAEWCCHSIDVLRSALESPRAEDSSASHLLGLFGRTRGLPELFSPHHGKSALHPALREPLSSGRVPRASQRDLRSTRRTERGEFIVISTKLWSYVCKLVLEKQLEKTYTEVWCVYIISVSWFVVTLLSVLRQR